MYNIWPTVLEVQSKRCVILGVPQDPILDPSLLYFVNDFHNFSRMLSKMLIRQYADDIFFISVDSVLSFETGAMKTSRSG